MNIILRLLLLIIVVPPIYYFIFWLPMSLIPIDFYWLRSSASLLCSTGVGWFVWSKTHNVTDSKSLVTSIVFGTILAGSIGFAVGFFGPIILMPEANQGPLVGIFFTGPLGCVLGGLGGLIYWLVKNKKSMVS